MNKLQIIIIVIGMVALACSPALAQENPADWEMTLSNHVIWIGETLEINVTGRPHAWVQVTLAKANNTNISYGWDYITDENGTAWFVFDDFYTEQPGRYLVELRVEGNRTPVLIDVIDINYDDVLYIFMILERWGFYFDKDIDDFNPLTDQTLQDELDAMRMEIAIAKILVNKIFWMVVLIMLAMSIPWIVLVWLFWDDIDKRIRLKGDALQIPRSKIRMALKLKNPRVSAEGQLGLTKTPTFDDGKTKHDKEKKRRWLMKKHRTKPELIELADKTDDEKWLDKQIRDWFVSQFDKLKENKKKRGSK